MAAQNEKYEVDMDRIIEMDKAGLSHKPLVRVDVTDEEVLDTLENWGVFEFALDAREWFGVFPEKAQEEYACYMTDPEDLERDGWSTPGTSCVIINPVLGGYGIQRHSHDGRWEPAFGMHAFPTLEEACEYLKPANAWESRNRKALEVYRQQKVA